MKDNTKRRGAIKYYELHRNQGNRLEAVSQPNR